MIEIIPAIDIIDGKCVRLSKGDYDSKKIYNENPVEVAKEFEAMGIERPKDEYGFFPQERIDRLKKEQAQMRKSDAVM